MSSVHQSYETFFFIFCLKTVWLYILASGTIVYFQKDSSQWIGYYTEIIQAFIQMISDGIQNGKF